MSHAELARRLPDLPRWVEARALLRDGDGEVYGLRETPELALAVRDPEEGYVVVIGRPHHEAIRAAATREPVGEVGVPPEHADWVAAALPAWAPVRAFLHVLTEPDRLPPPSDRVRLLDPDAIPRLDVPDTLRRELTAGARGSPVAATFVDGAPVSFCYAGSITESLWDVAIDSLEAHRRRGHAAACAAHLVRHFAPSGRRPVWGSHEDNPASWRLARKIGFTPADELVLFRPPALTVPHDSP